jgi:hypothetical protein
MYLSIHLGEFQHFGMADNIFEITDEQIDTSQSSASTSASHILPTHLIVLAPNQANSLSFPIGFQMLANPLKEAQPVSYQGPSLILFLTKFFTKSDRVTLVPQLCWAKISKRLHKDDPSITLKLDPLAMITLFVPKYCFARWNQIKIQHPALVSATLS